MDYSIIHFKIYICLLSSKSIFIRVSYWYKEIARRVYKSLQDFLLKFELASNQIMTKPQIETWQKYCLHSLYIDFTLTVYNMLKQRTSNLAMSIYKN